MWADEQETNERRQAVQDWGWPATDRLLKTTWGEAADAYIRQATRKLHFARIEDPPEGNRAEPVHKEVGVGEDEAIWNLFWGNGMWPPGRHEPVLLPKEKEELVRLRERERIMKVREDHWVELVQQRERNNRMEAEYEDLYQENKALKARALMAEATRDSWMGDNQRMRLEAQEHGMIADDLTARLERWQRVAVAAMSLASGMVAAVAAHLAGVL